ncbi:MAG: diguanylate cyclase [Gammaproteobacteria bacterium]
MNETHYKAVDNISTESAVFARVLLIDDQAIVGEALRRMVESEPDIAWHYCADPTRAMSAAIEFQPTVILQDLVMPEIDGLVLLRFFRANPVTKTTPIIVLSSKEDPKTKSEAFKLGATDYLVKFPDQIEVIARIRAHTRTYLAQQQRDEAYRALRSMQIELEMKNAELQRLSSLDGLTGIGNRRRFDEYLEQEWLRAARDGNILSLILIDIDHFKAYNDNYGHQGGDECLRKVAQTLDATLKRAGDVVARYGGEEFAVVLPDTDAGGAALIAEKLRASVDALGFAHAHSKTTDHVTISLGVAGIVPRDGGNPADLVKIADEALYEAKESGRNRFRIAAAPVPGPVEQASASQVA